MLTVWIVAFWLRLSTDCFKRPQETLMFHACILTYWEVEAEELYFLCYPRQLIENFSPNKKYCRGSSVIENLSSEFKTLGLVSSNTGRNTKNQIE